MGLENRYVRCGVSTCNLCISIHTTCTFALILKGQDANFRIPWPLVIICSGSVSMGTSEVSRWALATVVGGGASWRGVRSNDPITSLIRSGISRTLN